MLRPRELGIADHHVRCVGEAISITSIQGGLFLVLQGHKSLPLWFEATTACGGSITAAM